MNVNRKEPQLVEEVKDSTKVIIELDGKEVAKTVLQNLPNRDKE